MAARMIASHSKPVNPAEQQVKTLKGLWEENARETERLIRLYGDAPNRDAEIARLRTLANTRKTIEQQLDAALVAWALEMEQQLKKQPD